LLERVEQGILLRASRERKLRAHLMLVAVSQVAELG
jgi:hypothetical protein